MHGLTCEYFSNSNPQSIKESCDGVDGQRSDVLRDPVLCRNLGFDVLQTSSPIPKVGDDGSRLT